ncbi:MAG TPA: hypothetical protein VII72_11655 [Myxococcota bacterium]|jgi:hypothetical protein
MFVKLLGRDLAILAVSVLAWRLAAPLSAGSGVVSDVAGVLLGFLFGVCAFLIHEWGHLAGAVASRSAIQPPTGLASPFVFSFESRKNSRRQFLSMSFSGFVATAAVVWAAYALLPSDLLATRVARGLVVFLTFLGVVLEVPLVIYSLLTRRVPPVDGLEAPRQTQRAAA